VHYELREYSDLIGFRQGFARETSFYGQVCIRPAVAKARTLETLEHWLSLQAKACSRPPEPTTSTTFPLIANLEGWQFG
jgi:hypothetical protein